MQLFGLSLPEWSGLAGFALSLTLAVIQWRSSRLRIKAGPVTVMDDRKDFPSSVLLHVCLSNQTNTPFSLVDAGVKAGREKAAPVDKTVLSYRTKVDKGPAVKRVLLSPAFPVRFDSYASQEILLQVPRQHISNALPPQGPFGPAAAAQKQAPHTGRRETRLPRLRLILNTSRGRRVIPLRLESVQGLKWLALYADHRAAAEGTIEISGV